VTRRGWCGEGDGGAPDDSIVVPSMTACAYAEYDDETHGTHQGHSVFGGVIDTKLQQSDKAF